MTIKRTAPPDTESLGGLPHDQDREGGQPYAKEVEDYNHGVASPPEDQGERELDHEAKKTAPLPRQR